MSETRPIRIGDTVRVVAEKRSLHVGAVCKVLRLDVLNNVVEIQYKNRGYARMYIQDVEIVSSPEWQLKLI